ncbi:MAG TPA: alpha/beta hydrolase-fold protein [Gemmatimonadales bacterium]|nr:alpha/beta hydrolase-fold protein [Gemmatimonadales bacterium]
MRIRMFAALAAAGLAAVAPLAAQSGSPPSSVTTPSLPVIIGERTTFRSAILGAEYPLVIYRPGGYERSAERYPLLILLDGDGHFHHASGVVDFLVANQRIPPMIVVGVGNRNRTRDLTPPTADPQMRNQTGGADRFLRFLGDELIPYLDRTNRTLDYRVLVGHSFGGLFALHALTTRPEIFDGYIAISPSTWWNQQALVNDLPEFLAKHRELRASLYMTTGNEGGEMLTSAQRIAEILKHDAPPTMQWEFHHMPDETHGSIPHRSLYDGLETMFADLRIELDTTMRTVADLERRYETLSAKYGYTIPVTEPMINRLGYILLGRGLHGEAIAVFRVNTERYPQSANTFDSLGDGYEAAGDLQNARTSFARAVELARKNNDPVLDASAEKLTSVTSKLGASVGQ